MSEPDHADDADLVAGCRQGDAAAWEALVNRYQRLVYAIALRAGADEHGAADVFQTVFVRLLAHVQRLAQPDRLRAWIVTTAKREALRLRQVGRRTVSLTPIEGDDAMPLEDTLPDDSPLAEQALAELQQLELLRRGLEGLEERCRSLLRLLFRDDDERVDYANVARELAIPVGSIGPTRARCLGKLRRLME